ncbi:lysozyme inhibitor LprI family protein [Sphingomonas aracearum]|uniref:DUF1311 domain-containing protein n=1 Tax=Sphingomonas aracearum TaxID=2283317 RepID=A0A369VZW4_9SPHN|nr:lysozyme inhibitor LprI family protein [Sphingomonas aracearum]RDE07339.1 DUF1311 domain-containing protein [Sphingomonas aracearum]
MTRRFFSLAAAAAAALVASAVPAAAQTAGAFMTNPAFRDPAPRRCTSTVELQHCAAHDLRVADAQMSARYSALRKRLGTRARQRLLVEQRQWLKQRDRGCIERGRGGGSIASLNVAQCWVSVTRARTRALATWRA